MIPNDDMESILFWLYCECVCVCVLAGKKEYYFSLVKNAKNETISSYTPSEHFWYLFFFFFKRDKMIFGVIFNDRCDVSPTYFDGQRVAKLLVMSKIYIYTTRTFLNLFFVNFVTDRTCWAVRWRTKNV